MEEATHSTVYAASIKHFQRKRDGKAAYGAIIKQYTGDDKWTDEVTKKDSLIYNDKLKGTGNFALERSCAAYRNTFEQLTLASGHIPYHLPTQYTRVEYFLDEIERSNSELPAAMSGVWADKAPDGNHFDFEKVVSFLIHANPVAIRLGNQKCNTVQISSIITDNKVSPSEIKTGIRKTGV